MGYAGELNLYGYCGNNPANCSDPNGTFLHLILGAVIGGIGGGIYAEMNGKPLLSGIGIGALIGVATAGTAGLATEGMTLALGADSGLESIAGGVGAMAADATSQGLEIGVGWRSRVDPGQVFAAGALGAIPGGVNGPQCFVSGTPVQMANGSTKPIEKVRVGDKVWSRDENTGKMEARRVLHTVHHHTSSIVHLKLANSHGKVVQSLLVSTEHPFWVVGKGWVGASHLGIGTQVVTRAGPKLTVHSVLPEHKACILYNFTFSQLHLFTLSPLTPQKEWNPSESGCV